MPKLFASPASPFARKVRMVLGEKNIPYEFVEQGPSTPGNQIADMNPLGKVPVLLTDDQRAVYDSRVIVEYIEVLHPEVPMLPPPGMARVSVRRWEALADGMTDAVVAVAIEQAKENDLQRDPHWIAKQLVKVQRALNMLANDIDDNSYCHGDRYSLADIAVMAALPYLERRLPAIQWRSDYPALSRFFDLHSQRRSFIDTAPPAPAP